MKFADFLENRHIFENDHARHQPLVSVVLPTYNRSREGLLKPCIDSVLAQTYTNFELIILDDASDDDSADVIRQYARQDSRIVAVFHEHNSGLPALRADEGILLARGQYIAFIFDDNTWQPEMLQTMLTAAQQTNAEMVVGQISLLDAGQTHILGGLPISEDLLFTFNSIPNGAVLCQRQFFDRYGMYDPHIILRRICDWDLWLRALRQGVHVISVPQVIGVEKGLKSAQSLGNTVRWDKKISLAYMTDIRTSAARLAALRPTTILDYDPFDPEPIVRYVRDMSEWDRVEEQVYTPFSRSHLAFPIQLLIRHNHLYDTTMSDYALNPQSPLFNDRKRVLVVANRFDRQVREWWIALHQNYNFILVPTNELGGTEFLASDFDLIVLFDACSMALLPFLRQCQDFGIPIVDLVIHGLDAPAGKQTASSSPDFSKNKALLEHFQNTIYFSHPGTPWNSQQLQAARILMDCADQTFRLGSEKLESIIPIDFVMNQIPPDYPDQAVIPHVYLGDATQCSPTFQTILAQLVQNLPSGESCRVYGSASNLPDCLKTFANQLIYRTTAETLPNLIEHVTQAIWLVPDAPLPNPSDYLQSLTSEDLARRNSILLVYDGQRDAIDLDISTALAASETICQKSQAYRPDARWIHYLNFILGVMVRKKVAILRRLDHARDVRCAGMVNSQLLGGSEIYGLLVVRTLAKLGFDFSVHYPNLDQYSSGPDRIIQWAAENDLPKPEPAEYGRCSLALHSPGFSEQESAAYAKNFRRWLSDRKIGLLFLSGFISEPLIAPDNSRLVFMGLFPPWGYNLQFMTFARDRIDGLVSDSAWAARHWGEWIAPPITPVYSLIGREFFVVQNAHLPTSPVQIAVVGTMIESKRQKEILLAFSQLIKEGQNIHLNFYGHELKIYADYINEIRQIASEPHLIDQVAFHGFVPDPNEILRNNHIILSASGEESIPQGVLFHQASGFLPVACPAGGIEEMVRDGETGFLADGFSVAEIAQALRRALQNQSQWPAMIARGRQLLLQNCSEEWFAHQILRTMLEGACIHVSEGGRYFSRRSAEPVTTVGTVRSSNAASGITCRATPPPLEAETLPMQVGPDLGPVPLIYSLVAEQNNFSGIQLRVATYHSALRGTVKFELRIADTPYPVRKGEIRAERLADNAWILIGFHSIRNSAEQTFSLHLSAHLQSGRAALYEVSDTTRSIALWTLRLQRKIRRHLAFRIRRPGKAAFAVYQDSSPKE